MECREARCDLSGFTAEQVREVLALARVPIDAEIGRLKRAIRRCTSLDADDLRSIGQIAALEAYKKFDPTRSSTLRSWIGTVVRWRISEAVKRAGDRASREVSFGLQVQTGEAFDGSHSLEPTLSFTGAQNRPLTSAAAGVRSGGLTPMACEALSNDPTEAYELANMRKWVLRSMGGLTPRQKILLTQRIANNDESDARLAETLGVNKAQVCRDLDVAISVLQSRVQNAPRDMRKRLLEMFQAGQDCQQEAVCV